MTQLEHYNQIKEQYKDALILFRCGDFYETYCEDAAECANILGITLTHRSDKKPSYAMTGFPFHALDTYLPKLVRAGKRIAICDPVDDKPTAQAEKVTCVTDDYWIAYFDTTRLLNVCLTKDASKAETDYKVTYSVDGNVLTLFKDGTPMCIASNFILKFK